MRKTVYDAVIIGSGPNGLAAAITLAQAGLGVLVVEGYATIGGGMRTLELTLPGFRHDICSAIHPLGLASPFLRSLPLAENGLAWITPHVALAHPLDGGRAVTVTRSMDETAAGLGADGPMWRALFGPLVSQWQAAIDDLLAPFHLPRHPLLLARYAPALLSPATWLARTRLQTEEARAVFAGMAGHSIMPLERPTTAAFGTAADPVGAHCRLARGTRRLASHCWCAHGPSAAARRCPRLRMARAVTGRIAAGTRLPV